MQDPSLRLRPQSLQLRDRVAAHPIQFAHGQQNRSLEGVLKTVQFERRSSQSSQLLTQSLSRQRLLAGQAVDLGRYCPLKFRRLSRITFSQPAIQLRIASLPKLIASVYPTKIYVTPAKAQFS